MILPMVIPYRNGGVKIGKKSFSRGDINDGMIMRETLQPDVNWFGGRVYSFGKNLTYKGLYLCVEGQIDDRGNMFPGAEIIGIFIKSFDELSPESLELLEEEGLYSPNEVAPIEEVKPSEDVVEAEESESIVDIVKMAETMASVNDIVNKRLATREKRVSNPV